MRPPRPGERAHGGLRGAVDTPLRGAFTGNNGRIKMLEAPSGIRGSAFCTVKRRPFTLMSKIESKCSSVILPRGANLAPPALAKTTSSLAFARLMCAKSRSRSPRFDTSPWRPLTFLPISFTAAANSGSRRPVMKTYAPSFTNSFAVARPMPLLPPVMRAVLPSSLPMTFSSVVGTVVRRARAKGLAAARYYEIRDDDLNGLVVLVERRRSRLDQPLIGTRPRGPHLENLALGAQLISRPHRPWPAELVSAGAHDATGGFEVAVDQEPHGDGGRMPTTGGQSSEDRVPGGFLVGMERLRIELGAECLDSLLVDPQPTGAKGLPDGKVFEESSNHGH